MNKIFDPVVRVWRFFPRPVRFLLALLFAPLLLSAFIAGTAIAWTGYFVFSMLHSLWESVE